MWRIHFIWEIRWDYFCIKREMKKSWALENKPQINSRRAEILLYLFLKKKNSLETCTVPRNSIQFFFVCVINKGENRSWAPMSSSINSFNVCLIWTHFTIFRSKLWYSIKMQKWSKEKDCIHIYLLNASMYKAIHIHYNSNRNLIKDVFITK